MFPYLRSNENPAPRGNYSVGILVMLADGRKFFFPGSEPEDGMILARIALSDDELDHPITTIEFGVRTENEWVQSKLVKASALTPTES